MPKTPKVSEKARTKLQHANRLLEVLCEASRETKYEGRHLIAREENGRWYIRTFDKRNEAKAYRDSLAEWDRQPGIQPFYVRKDGDPIMQ